MDVSFVPRNVSFIVRNSRSYYWPFRISSKDYPLDCCHSMPVCKTALWGILEKAGVPCFMRFCFRTRISLTRSLGFDFFPCIFFEERFSLENHLFQCSSTSPITEECVKKLGCAVVFVVGDISRLVFWNTYNFYLRVFAELVFSKTTCVDYGLPVLFTKLARWWLCVKVECEFSYVPVDNLRLKVWNNEISDSRFPKLFFSEFRLDFSHPVIL